MREELFIHRSWTTAGTTGATTGTTGYLRSNGKKSLGFARNKPTGTTGLLSALPTIAGTTGGRPVPPAVQISATKVSADLACRYYRRFTGTTGTGRYHRSEPGTTGSSFSRKTQEKGWHCRYHRPWGPVLPAHLGREEIFLSVCECKRVSQAHWINWLEHLYPHLTNLICIPLDSAAFPKTQQKIKAL